MPDDGFDFAKKLLDEAFRARIDSRLDKATEEECKRTEADDRFFNEDHLAVLNALLDAAITYLLKTKKTYTKEALVEQAGNLASALQLTAYALTDGNKSLAVIALCCLIKEEIFEFFACGHASNISEFAKECRKLFDEGGR